LNEKLRLLHGELLNKAPPAIPAPKCFLLAGEAFSYEKIKTIKKIIIGPTK
jgi:hypothetical protein